MTSGEPKHPKAWRASRIGLAALALPLVLMLVLILLAGTPPALGWLARQAGAMSGGEFVLEGVEGSLYGPMRIAFLRVDTGEERYELKGAHLDWSPSALLHRHLRIDEFTLSSLTVTRIKPSPEPPRLPASLRLPVSLSIPDARVERLVLRQGTTEHVFEKLAFSIEKPADVYQLHLARLSTPWGRVQGDVSLADAAPYALTGQARLAQDRGLHYALEAKATGNLSRIALEATATAPGGQANAEAIVTPFDALPLASARIDAHGVDPSRIIDGAPEGDIGGLVRLHSQDRDNLTGEIDLRNAQPGTLDKGRLPLRRIEAGFEGPPAHLSLSPLRLDLGEAGRFEGKGGIDDGHLQLTLATRDFDPKGLHGKARTLKLVGEIRFSADAQTQDAVADLSYQRYRFHLDASNRDGLLTFKEASLRAPGGELSLRGSLALADNRKFQLSGKLAGFDPAAFGDYPKARLNATFTAEGQLAPELRVRVRYAMADSVFRNQPLSGQGRLDIAGQRLRDSDMVFRLARNSLRAKGSLGAPGDRLDFHVDAPDLAAFDPAFGGSVSADGALEGRYTAPSGHVELAARKLHLGRDYRLARLSANARLEPGQNGALALDADAEGVATPKLGLDRVQLVGRGRRDAHTLRFTLRNPAMGAEGRLAGGWHDGAGWTGRILELVNRGRHPLALEAPAGLEAGPGHFRLADARFAFDGAAFTIKEAKYTPEGIVSQGAFKGLAVQPLLNLAAPSDDFKTDLSLAGEWRLDMRDTVNGELRLSRERGDIILATVPQTVLGLTNMTLDLKAVDGELRGRMEAEGTALGQIKAEARSTLSRRDGVWGIAGNAPIKASADLAVKSIAWAAPLVARRDPLSVDGALTAHVRVGGRVDSPEYAGTISGDRLRLEWPGQGVRLQDGHFQAEIQDQVLLLKQLSLHGGEGQITGEGRLALKPGMPDLKLSLKADRMAVISRPDRYLVLSGTGEASTANGALLLAARLKADRGMLELPKGDEPTPSSDVYVVGQTRPAGEPARSYPMRLELDLDLGEHFFVQGHGLDAQLGGAVKLRSTDGALPKATGSIRVVKGAYTAYGQRLQIDQGIINFQGPVDNPGLNIVAMRKDQDIEAGVAITGTARMPTVKLVSNPDVPDSEKLSWLVLGHGSGGGSSQEIGVLQAAAGALLAMGESVTLQQRVAHATGLEEVSLKGDGTLESTVLTLGKRLSSRVYLGYEMGLAGTNSVMTINYAMTKRLSLRATAGAFPSLDVFYTFTFD